MAHGRPETTTGRGRLAVGWNAERPGRLPMKFVAAVGIALLDGEPERRARGSGRNGRLLLLTCDAVPLRARAPRTCGPCAWTWTRFRTILRFEGVGTYGNCTIDQATWSPNGKTVLYSTFRGIWTIRGVDGKRKRSVLDVGSHAAWAPNGREVVFVQRVEESQADALFRVGVDGSGLRRITTPVESYIYGPSWSPDGRTIAFTVYDNGQESIWTVGANGSRLRKIAAERRACPAGRLTAGEIIFTDRLGILTMAPDGSRRRYVTPPVLEDETFQATYSPDGSKIAYVRDWRVWVMTAEAARSHRLACRRPRLAGRLAAPMRWPGPARRRLRGGRSGSAGSAPDGLTWTANGPDGGGATYIEIDPRTPSTLYAGTTMAGVFRSTNGGRTWERRSNGLPANAGVGPFELAPSDPSRLYAVKSAATRCSRRPTPERPGDRLRASRTTSTARRRPEPAQNDLWNVGPGLSKSTDGGQTWTRPDRLRRADRDRTVRAECPLRRGLGQVSGEAPTAAPRGRKDELGLRASTASSSTRGTRTSSTSSRAEVFYVDVRRLEPLEDPARVAAGRASRPSRSTRDHRRRSTQERRTTACFARGTAERRGSTQRVGWPSSPTPVSASASMKGSGSSRFCPPRARRST